MSFLHDLYFFQGQKYTSFGKNILLRQSTSLGHSSTGHPVINILTILCVCLITFVLLLSDSRRVCWKLLRERGVRGLVRPQLHLRRLPHQQPREPESEHGPRLRAGQQPVSGQQRRGRGRGQPRPAAAEEEVHGGAAPGLRAAAPCQSRENQPFRFSTASGSEEDQE